MAARVSRNQFCSMRLRDHRIRGFNRRCSHSERMR